MWLVRGAVPKFGLAYVATTGALALGTAHRDYPGGVDHRSAIEVLAGERVLTTSVEVGAGWVLGVVALGLTVVAGVSAAVGWGGTVMDDDGPLDASVPCWRARRSCWAWEPCCA